MTTTFNCDLPLPTTHINTLALYCSDGRFAEQFNQFLVKQLNIDYCDRLVVPGGPGVLAHQSDTQTQARATAEQLQFLIAAHNIQRVILIFHEDCGYYKACAHVNNDQMQAQQQSDMKIVLKQVNSMADNLNIETYIARIDKNSIFVEPF